MTPTRSPEGDDMARGRQTIDDVPSCGQENDYRRASPVPSADRDSGSSWRDSWEKLPRPEDWIICEECTGQGEIETVYPFPDDPYFCAVNKCEACNGKGGHLRDTTSSVTSTDKP